MKLQPDQTCAQQLKLLGAQQLEDMQGKPETAQLNPLQTTFDTLFIFFFYRCLLPSGGEKYSSKTYLLSCWMNNCWMSKINLQGWKRSPVLLKQIDKKLALQKFFWLQEKQWSLIPSAAHSSLRKGHFISHQTKSLHIIWSHYLQKWHA